MKKDNITIKDIAEACAVGLGSVSRAINGKPGVKPEVRRKILAYINDIGWSSSSLSGRFNGLSQGKLVVFAIPQFGMFLSSPEFSETELLDSLLDRCIQEGYETLIFAGNRAKAFEQCRKIHPYAIIQPSSVVRLCPQESELCAQGIRLITLSNQQDPTGAAVYPDYEQIGVQLARSLRREGHHNIAFFGGLGALDLPGSITDVPTHRLRMILGGVAKTLPDFRTDRDLFSDNHASPLLLESALRAGRHTAWICDCWKSCAIFLRMAHRLQLRVPQNISLVTIAPEKPDYIFPFDITRSCPDLRRNCDRVMELLSIDPFPAGSHFICPNLFIKGESIMPNQQLEINNQ